MKFRIIVLLCAAAVSAAAQAYTVMAHLPGSMDGAMARLSDYVEGTQLDSALVADSMVIFKGSIDSPRALLLTVDDKQYIMPTTDRDSIDLTVTEEVIKGGIRWIYDYKGSSVADLIEAMRHEALEASGYDKEETPEKHMEAARLVRQGYYRIMSENADNTIGAWMFENLYNSVATKEEKAEMVAAADANAALKKFDLVNEMLSIPSVGDRFVDFCADDFDGIAHRLSDVAGRGRYVLLDFWASWCRPCIKSMPEMKILRDKYPEDKLYIIGITLDDNLDYSRDVIERENLSWPCWVGNKECQKVNRVAAIPYTVLISPDGTVLYQGHFNSEAVAAFIK